MGSEGANPEARLRPLLAKLQAEAGVLDRIVYKNKNQHRRCPYFQWLLKVRSDLRLLQSAGLGEILNTLFPIIDGKKPAQKAYLPTRQKKKFLGGRHSYQERLLGVARLLSQMTEPILKAAIMYMLRTASFKLFGLHDVHLAMVQHMLQILLDVVSVYNKVSSLSQKTQSLKVAQAGIEAFREFYPCTGEVLMLECVWEKDKFVLRERMQNSNGKNLDESLREHLLEAPVQYETMEVFNEVGSVEPEVSSEKTEMDFPATDSCSIGIQPTIDLYRGQSSTVIDDKYIVDCGVEKRMINQNFPNATAEGILSSSVDSRPSPSPKSLDPQTESKKKVAFVPVRASKISEANIAGPNKKMKLDLLSSNATEGEDRFLDLLMSGSMKNSIF